MDLTQYKLEELIENSNIKIDGAHILYKNLKLFTIILVIEALILCPLTWSFINSTIYLWLVAVMAPIKTGLNFLTPSFKKKRANKKLTEVVSILKEHGIDTSKTKLMKAKIKSRYLKCIISENGAKMTSCHIILFQDRNEQIKALKQARAELVSFQFPFRNTIVGETKIIENEKIAKQLYLDMKR